MKISRINMYDKKVGEDRLTLDLMINENGDLQFVGQDLGPGVEKLTGEYEYFLTIHEKYNYTIVENLLKEHFIDDDSFKKWLDQKQIPSEGYVAPAEYNGTILLNLIKEYFENDSSFKKWLDAKQIPSESYVV